MLHNETLDVIPLSTTPLNDYKKVCNSSTIYIVLLAVFFITGIYISSVFIYFQWYLKKITRVLSLIQVLKQQFIECNSTECNSIEHDEDYMKIKFNSDDDLPLNTILKVHMLTVIVRSVFEEDGKYYPQVFLDECLYEL